MGVHQEVMSTSGPGTAAGTDSVRPTSQPGLKLGTNEKSNKKPIRPTTVGGAAHGSNLFRRSDYTRMMRSTANQNSVVMQNLVDDFVLGSEEATNQ